MGVASSSRVRVLPGPDRTRIGTLDVPHMGVGTIAWSPDTPEDVERYGAVARTAIDSGLDFFDTAERYGAKGTALIPAALAAVGLPVEQDYLGGDTEQRLASWAPGSNVATKFAPTPWRGDAASVVDACRGSAERLGVEGVDLMQVHMPDIIQPFKAFGLEKRNEEAHWDGLAECYHSGLAKNVGVSNYGPTLLERAHEHLAKRGVPLASNQIHLNLLYRRQGSLAAVAKGNELGVKTLAYYPLAMGLLTGKLTGAQLRARDAEGKDLRARELLRYLEGGEGSLNIRIRDQTGEETFFKVKKTTKLDKVFNAYSTRKGVAATSLRFLFDGSRVRGDQTPADIDMEDGDQLDCMLEQQGGL